MVMCYILNDIGPTVLNFITENKFVKDAQKNKFSKHCLEITRKDTNVRQTLLDACKL